MRCFYNYILSYLFGGAIYCIIELIWRRRTHYSMFFAGGISFSILVFIGAEMKTTPFLLKCLFGAAAITAVEFIFGYIFNIKYEMAVWNYSSIPFNILGQICLPFSALWFLLCAAVYRLLLNDWFYSKVFIV